MFKRRLSQLIPYTSNSSICSEGLAIRDICKQWNLTCQLVSIQSTWPWDHSISPSWILPHLLCCVVGDYLHTNLVRYSQAHMFVVTGGRTPFIWKPQRRDRVEVTSPPAMLGVAVVRCLCVNLPEKIKICANQQCEDQRVCNQSHVSIHMLNRSQFYSTCRVTTCATQHNVLGCSRLVMFTIYTSQSHCNASVECHTVSQPLECSLDPWFKLVLINDW